MMKFTVLAFISIFVYEVSCAIKCNQPAGCLTLADMGSRWGGYFKNQENAPCLSGIFGGSNVYCFTSKQGSLNKCTCYDDSVHYDNKWCNTGLYGQGHTMCKYQDGAQSSCGDVKVSGVTSQADKDTIVDKHNELRAKVANGQEDKGVNGVGQPNAANMRKLVWSDELAEVAQRWVDQCTNGHDKNRNTEKFSWVGQNWAWRSNWKEETVGVLSTKMVESWYSEVKDVKAGQRSGSTGVIGHYTQLVWADTYEVGCGFMTSVKTRNFESVLVCNYGPGGNFGDQPIYKQGNPGTQCPSGTTNTSDGLCA